ncbi:MAG: ERCC4 domain-containing protein [Nitrososphaerales archaeon]
MHGKARIVVDERERQSGVAEKLSTLGTIVDFKQLDVGDYIVATDCAIERKSVQDLIKSIYDGRLFIQCSQLSAHYNRPILVLEGSTDSIERLVDNPMVFYGALASIALDFRIPIIHTTSVNHTAEVLVALANRVIKNGKTGPLLMKVKKGNQTQIQQLTILTSLPGVGNKLAVRLLKKFKTPIKALNASTAELASIEGMGYTRAAKIRKVLDTHDTDKKGICQTALDGYDVDNNNT